MKTLLHLAFLFSVSSLLFGQSVAAPANPPDLPATGSMISNLDRLQSAASQTNIELGHLRIEKWKADAGSKQQAQANADSIQRNLTTALPGLIDNVRSAPQSVDADFKLYRNLNVLYDVLASLTESTGAFGLRSDYDALAQQLSVMDSVRRNLGDELEKLTASTQSELNQLRAQVHTMQQQQSAAATPPKKVIVDDSEAPKKTAHKKKPAQKSGAQSSSSGTGTGSVPMAKEQ
jgi:hypothetical protein